MQATASFKFALLKHMLVGLRGVSSGNMGVLERKAAINRVAYMAMAAARGGGARWSRFLLADFSRNKALVAGSPGGAGIERLQGLLCRGRRSPSGKNKILRRSFRTHSRAEKRLPAPRRAASATLLARRMVKKRAQVLRRLVPGGKALDSFCLLEETLDYVVSLRAQVELMRTLTSALGVAHSSTGSHPSFNDAEKKD